jgi:hypothetical protein
MNFELLPKDYYFIWKALEEPSKEIGKHKTSSPFSQIEILRLSVGKIESLGTHKVMIMYALKTSWSKYEDTS